MQPIHIMQCSVTRLSRYIEVAVLSANNPPKRAVARQLYLIQRGAASAILNLSSTATCARAISSNI